MLENMALKESLFSLEVVVEHLNLADVTCRFPAIAFRLLDFPTLLIEHVQPDLANKILQSLQLDVNREIPRQIPELQDRNGTFILKKGKSCLFKIVLDTLCGHLASTPLYVLLTDNFSDPPKLVGSCLVSLHKTVQLISQDVAEAGLSVPSVHGEKGTYKLYNLMGIEIGDITLAVRLLSLGEGLIQHIPDSQIAKPSKGPARLVENSNNDINDNEGVQEIQQGSSKSFAKKKTISDKPQYRDVLIQDLEIADENQPQHIVVSDIQNVVYQPTRPSMSMATQTAFDVGVQTRTKTVSDDNEELDEPFLSNVYCPPSLYFKKDGEEKRPAPKYAIFHYNEIKPKETDLESVRSDDALFDLLEDNLSQTQVKSKVPQFVAYQQLESQPVVSESQVVPQPPNLRQMLSSPNFQADQFPFLRALMAELSFIQGVPMQQQQPQLQPQQTEPAKQYRPLVNRSSPKTAWQPSRTKEKENQSDFVARLATPKHIVAEEHACSRKGRHDCTHDHSALKQKSWIRKQPQFGQKPKLHYGLTNTMRLRLAATNPKMLRTLEDEEIANRTFKVNQIDNHVPVRSTKVGLSENGVQHRKPVPTPRRPSLPIEVAEIDEAEKQAASEERSVMVHSPSASDHDETESDVSMSVQYAHALLDDTDEKIDVKPPSGRLNTYPPFANNVQAQKPATANSNKENMAQFSEYVDDSKLWMSTDEPELQELRDSEESASDKSADVKPVKAIQELVCTDLRDSLKKVINPRSSDKSPVTALRMSQSVLNNTDHKEEIESPTPRPRRLSSLEDIFKQRKRSVSFEAFPESEDTTSPTAKKSLSPLSSQETSSSPLVSKIQTPVVLPQIPARSSSVESTEDLTSHRTKSKNRKPVPKLPLSLHTDSVSSYMPSDLELENLANISVDDEYTEDFEGSDDDININPFLKIPPSLLGYTA
ncbi:microtubule-associated protein 10-like [Tubulanus polymorphus]|uniref:microtubule-associated protein 10-like n=1 Tax=Tubulanus polymorphus TaxID=672921 RepID=UPI003DA31EBA